MLYRAATRIPFGGGPRPSMQYSLDSKPLRKAAWYTLFTHAPELPRTWVIVNCSIIIYQYSYSALVCKTLISVSFIMMSLKKEI